MNISYLRGLRCTAIPVYTYQKDLEINVRAAKTSQATMPANNSL